MAAVRKGPACLLVLALACILLLPASTHSARWPVAAEQQQGASSLHTLPFNTAETSSSSALVQAAVGLGDVQLKQLGLDAKPTTIWPHEVLERRQSPLPLEPWASDPAAKPMSVEGSKLWAGFDLELAKVFARLTSAAYCSNATTIRQWQCARCQRIPTFQVHTVVYDVPWALLAYVGYLPELKGIVAAFRGSDSHHWANWIENLRSWQHQRMWPVPDTRGKAPAARVHAGFYNMWYRSTLQYNITAAIQQLRELHPGASLYVTGHSMGAALAQLCALDAKLKFGVEHVHSYTFGSPRVGNAAFEQLFEGQVDSSWRFTHNRDVVPSLPPTLLGYHHVSREIWALDIASPVPGVPPQQQLFMCDNTGEDPTCHNSACLLGLCTSIMDHLTYLQYEMYHKAIEC